MTIVIASASISAALVAGIFFAFSAFVMRALARLEPKGSINAMQSINVAVLNPWFFAAFFGTGVLCLVSVVIALMGDAGTGRAAVLLGCALYLFGCIGVTAAGNVPLNDRLADVDPAGDQAAAVWNDYVTRWTRLNHVRTAASLLAALAFAAALATD